MVSSFYLRRKHRLGNRSEEYYFILIFIQSIEERKAIKDKRIDPITSLKALRIALEDSETCFFIKANFSNPEQKPEIVFNKWISGDEQGYKWHVEIIEKSSSSWTGKEKMLNIAHIEVDSRSGRIIERQYLKSILTSEYKQFLRNKKKLKSKDQE